jgi:hypothetical protein
MNSMAKKIKSSFAPIAKLKILGCSKSLTELAPELTEKEANFMRAIPTTCNR